MQAEFDALKALLDEKGIEYKASIHEKVHTSEEAAIMRGVPLQSGVKAMVVRGKEGFFLVLVPGNKRVNFEALPVTKPKLASPEDVFRITGCEVGSVHPFGPLFGLEVFMDRHILDNNIVNFSAGLHETSIALSPKAIVEIVRPTIGDYSIPK